MSVVAMLRATPQRPRVLCTASDRLLVQPIADHLGVFDEVIASDGARNLAGHAKAEALVERYGERGSTILATTALTCRSGSTPQVLSSSTPPDRWQTRPARKPG